MKDKPATTRNTAAKRKRVPKGIAPKPAVAKFKLKKILVPVDFSDCSIKALQYAITFAHQFNCSLTLIHVVQLHYGGALYGPLDFPLLEQDFQSESKKHLMELSKKHIQGKVPAKTVSRAGRPATEIAKAAKELHIDLIILSTHGYTGLAHAWMGSTAENVVRHAPCPVLTVREKERDFITLQANQNSTLRPH